MIKLDRRFVVLLAGILAIHFLSSTATVAAPRVRHVFIISFDQGNADLIRKSEMPTFHQMAAEGAHTWNAYTILPSVTLPAHTSMLTGVGAASASGSLERLFAFKWHRHSPDHLQSRQKTRAGDGDVRGQRKVQTPQPARQS
jgi:hypothetical protein